MCKIVVGVKNGKSEEFRALLKEQYYDLKKEKDGIGAIIINKDNKYEVFRELSDYEPVFEKIEDRLENAKIVMIHTRTKSSGLVDLNNVHFWEKDGYLFAHNGFASEYAYYQYPLSSYGSGYGFGHKNKDRKNPWEKTPDGKWRLKNTDKAGIEKSLLLDAGDIQGLEDILMNCEHCMKNQRGVCKSHKYIAKRIEELEDEAMASYETDYSFVPENDKGRKVITIIPEDKKTIVKVETKEAKEDEKYKYCDSYHFFVNMPKPFNPKKMKKFMDDSRFSGFAVVIEKATGRIWFLVDKRSYAINTDDFSFFFSYSPDTKIKKTEWFEVDGIPCASDEQQIDYPTLDICQGIHELKVASK